MLESDQIFKVFDAHLFVSLLTSIFLTKFLINYKQNVQMIVAPYNRACKYGRVGLHTPRASTSTDMPFFYPAQALF